MTYGTTFSDDRRHRFTLHRPLGGERGLLVFVGLNPSTADARVDDPTVRRCIRYGRDWGYSDLIVLNVFSVRSTDPTKLYKMKRPNREENDLLIEHYCRAADLVVAAWGVHGTHRGRAAEVLSILQACGGVYALALTKDGYPRHPLYLKADLRPQVYAPGGARLTVQPQEALDCAWYGGGPRKPNPGAQKGAGGPGSKHAAS